MIALEPLSDAADDAAWDEFLLSVPGSLVYHSTRYRDLLVDHLGCRPEYLVAREGGEIRGVMPMMWSDGMSSGGNGASVLNSLPFYGSHGGPVAVTDEAATALTSAWEERAADPGTAAATMVENPFLESRPDPPRHELTDERVSQVTPLPQGAGEDEILALVDSSARRNFRKAVKAGIEVELDEGALGDLHRLHAENMDAIGGLAKDAEFFEAVPRHLRAGDDFLVWAARLGGEVVSALLLLRFNGVTEYFTPATAHEHRSEQPLAAILVRAMADAAARGDRLWNWGGTWGTQDGVHRFKRKWGAEEGAYRYYVSVNDRSLLDSEPDGLRERFRHFYVVPFSALQADPKGAPR